MNGRLIQSFFTLSPLGSDLRSAPVPPADPDDSHPSPETFCTSLGRTCKHSLV